MRTKICIISDTHFSNQNDLLFNKIDVEQNFTSLIKKINNEAPNYIFILGDISQDGTPESYLKAKFLLNKLECNKYVLMGNHDSENIKYLLSDSIFMPDFLDIDDHRFIFISSYKGNNADDGHVKSKEFDRIRNTFDNKKSNYILVHHHFIKNNGIIDTWIMDNHLDFCSFLKEFPIKAVFHGHVHNGYRVCLGGIDIYAAPSTCIQFGLDPKLILEPFIGYQMLYLSDKLYEQKMFIELVREDKE